MEVILFFIIFYLPLQCIADNTPKRSENVEKKIVNFYQEELGSVDLASDFEYPKTASQKMDESLAAGHVIYNLGQDVAMIVTLGKSEAAVQVMDKGASGTQLINLVKPDAGDSIAAAEISHDALEKIKDKEEWRIGDSNP